MGPRSRKKMVAGLRAIPSDHPIVGEDDSLSIIDEESEDDLPPQVADSDGELSSELQLVHDSQVTHQLRLPYSNSDIFDHANPDNPSMIPSSTMEIGECSAPPHNLEDKLVQLAQSPSIAHDSVQPLEDVPNDDLPLGSEHPSADENSTKAQTSTDNLKPMGHQNANYRRANASKTAWVPKVPVTKDGMVDPQPDHMEGKTADPTFTDPIFFDPVLVDNPPPNALSIVAKSSICTDLATRIPSPHWHILEAGCSDSDD
ncbi:hypothetical protein Dimus_003012 [Dionaea muscipula]